MRRCSSSSGFGYGNTSSSWISPRKSDFENELTPCCGGVSCWVVAASMARPYRPRSPSCSRFDLGFLIDEGKCVHRRLQPLLRSAEGPPGLQVAGRRGVGEE